MSIRHGKKRFDQEQIGRPIWDAIYRDLFGSAITIKRDLGDLYEHFAIDTQITIPKWPIPFYGQEKSLSYFYGTEMAFDTLTVEFMQNPEEQEQGDIFRINAGFYACAYLNATENDFTHGGIVNWPSIIVATYNNKIRWQYNINQDGRARASFAYVNFGDIPEDCFLWRKHPVQL